MPHHLPIGMFDSGIGGLTILRRIIELMPNEEVLYFGDTARMPYGEKSNEAVTRYAIENTEFLLDKQIKLLIVACSTASAHAMIKLRELFKVPMVDVIEAGVHQAVATTKNQRIGIVGTRGTINSGIYQTKILKCLPKAIVTSIACPLLAPLVEENFAGHPAARLIVREYIAQLKDSSIDTLLLGCTHYPLLMPFFREELPEIAIIDPSASCAAMAASLLRHIRLQSEVLRSDPKHQFYVSDDPQKFCHVASKFLGNSIQVESIGELRLKI